MAVFFCIEPWETPVETIDKRDPNWATDLPSRVRKLLVRMEIICMPS